MDIHELLDPDNINVTKIDTFFETVPDNFNLQEFTLVFYQNLDHFVDDHKKLKYIESFMIPVIKYKIKNNGILVDMVDYLHEWVITIYADELELAIHALIEKGIEILYED